MDIPANFAMNPSETPHHYFKNLCLNFKKTIQQSKNPENLEFQMESMINASKELNWKKETTDKWKKESPEKIMNKVFNEFKRYINDLQKTPNEANYQLLLDSLEELNNFLKENPIY